MIMQHARVRFFVAVVALLMALAPRTAHAGEGYFYQGFTAFSASFYLVGGQYTIYVNARLPTSAFNTNAQLCVFGGVFERISPNPDSMTLGPAAAITTAVQYTIKPTVTLPAGHYQLKITTLTTCSWNFDIISTGQNTTGISQLQMLKKTPSGLATTTTASISDAVEFYVSYRSRNSQPRVSGALQIINGGQVVQSFPVRDAYLGRCNVFIVELSWEPNDARYLGKNLAKMVVKIGEEEFTSTEEFTLTRGLRADQQEPIHQ
jgi:hypothetical protein